MRLALFRRFYIAFIVLWVPLAFARQNSTENLPDTDRLIAVGKLWTTIRYFHPYLAYRDLDWDRAFCDALPAIREAKTPQAYAAALQRMLDTLHDPVTRAFVEEKEATGQPEALHIEQRPKGTLIVSAGASDSKETPSADAPARTLLAALEHAANVVFDLRSSTLPTRLLDDPAIQSQLTAATLNLPGQRTWIHNGLSPFRGANLGTYYSAFLVSRASV